MHVIKIEPIELSPEHLEAVEQELAHYALEKTGFDGGIRSFSFAAHIDNHLAGMIECRIFWGSLYIRRLLVWPQYRLQGLGRQLLETALAQAQEAACICAFVETMHFQALAFYEKFGFFVELAREGFSHDATLYYLRKDFA